MLQLVNTHEKQKKNSLINKESNKFAKQLDFTPNVTGRKNKAIEVEKT